MSDKEVMSVIEYLPDLFEAVCTVDFYLLQKGKRHKFEELTLRNKVCCYAGNDYGMEYEEKVKSLKRKAVEEMLDYMKIRGY